MTTKEQCSCCEEDFNQGGYIDATLGIICGDCAVGAMDGAVVFARYGVIGIYDGPCGDNEGGDV